MKTSYETTVLGYGNHAAIEIPDRNLQEIGGNKRSPLKVTVKNYTYQSTATVMDGKTLVVFPTKDRIATGTKSGDKITVTLELIQGYRQVDNFPQLLTEALSKNNLLDTFNSLSYSKRKEYARQINDAKSEDTIHRRIEKIISSIASSK